MQSFWDLRFLSLCVSLRSLLLCVEVLHLLSSSYPRRIACIFFEGGHDGLFAREAGLFDSLEGLQHALVVFRHDFDEPGDHFFPTPEDFLSTCAASVRLMTLNQFPELLDFVRILQFLQSDHLRVATA